MISVIYGPKGSGKTKCIIDTANTVADKATGEVVYIADNNQSLGLAPGVRFVNLTEYDVTNMDRFIGFIEGMLATDFDIQEVFIDGLSRLLGMSPEEMKPAFDAFAKVSDKVNFVVTVSADNVPAFLKPFAVKAK